MTTPLLPGIPLIESPLFAREMERQDWSEAERDVARQLHERGYAVIDFPDAEIDQRIARIMADLGPRFGLPADGPAPADVVAGLGDARLQDAWMEHEDVRAIAANPAILSLLSRLWGRQVIPFQTLNFPVGTQQHLHADAVHFSSQPERFMCGVWLAFEDLAPDSGLLQYLPGSHRWPIITNALLGRRGEDNIGLPSAQTACEDVWREMVAQDGGAVETFAARKGQALIWAANLLHGGGPRHDRTLTRWSQVTHYYFENCVYYTPAYSNEEVGKLHMRRIRDISTGEMVVARHLGEEVAMPRRGKPSLKRKVVDAWGVLKG